eukprot:c28975_g1_i3 orf=206-1726(-)
MDPLCNPHALVFPFPAQGHINPMMHLSRMLVSKAGFTITFVVTEITHRSLVEAHQDIDECHTSDIRWAIISDGLPVDFNRASDVLQFLTCINNMGGAFEDIVMRLNRQSPPLTCMITDSFLPWTQDVADKFGIPRIFFWTQSVAVYSIYGLHPHLLSNGYNPFTDIEGFKDLSVDRDKRYKATADIIARLPGLPPLDFADLPCDFRFFGSCNNWVIEIIKDQFRRLNEAICVIANTFHELESSVLEVMPSDVPVYPIGPIIPLDNLQPNDGGNCYIIKRGTSLWAESDEYREWLDDRAPHSVLYVSFGSAVSLTIDQFHELALGLMASGQPFLWSIRRNLYSTQVSEILPKGFLEQTKDQGIVVPWVPQLSVLAHTATGGFLSHCGWNSTLESISMGVPILAFPRFGDQRTNCRLIVDQWRIGLELKSEENGIVSKAEVLEKVNTLMQEEAGKKLRIEAERLRNSARRAVADNGSSDRNLQRLIGDVIRRQKRKSGTDSSREDPRA